MANGDTSSGLYDKIKDMLPYVAGAGIGAALGGPAGAVSGLGSAGEAELKQQDTQAQRQTKVAEMLMQSQQRKDLMEQRQQFHDDQEQDRQLQRTWMQVNQQNNLAQRKVYENASIEQRKQNEADRVADQQSRNQISQAMLALHEGNNISDSDYQTIIKGADPSWANFANAKSQGARKVAVDAIAKQRATASDSMVAASMKTIADKAYGGDMDKAMADWGNRSPAEIVRTAHGVLNRGLDTPDKVKKEADQNAAQASNLAKDLQSVDKTRKATFFAGKLGVGGTDARAHDLIHGLTGKTWESYTDTEKAKDERTLRQFLKANPDKANDYDAMAQVLRPKTTAPAPSGGIKQASAAAGATPDKPGGLPSGALRPSKLPDGDYESGGKKFTVKDGHLYPGE